ncbi:MAG: YabP/YqfC family sporulation protein [Peptococcaceae bacterium]|nr:YabP/YqfC family sporulation protein [Peptococcaceae bacterium]
MPFKNWQKKIGETLDLPEDLYREGPRITVIGFEVVMIEDFQQVIFFSEENVIVEVGAGHLELRGGNLVLAQMSLGEIEIKGEIHGLEFRKA